MHHLHVACFLVAWEIHDPGFLPELYGGVALSCCAQILTSVQGS